ncbi:MAG TPA: YggT family protein [Acinetobacter johnsonii]|nr:YggT family protein [Acinetobacter johnsonii]
MAQQQQNSDTKLVFIKISRALTYMVYGYALVASSFLALGFTLLLFSANASTPFVKFIYETAQVFLTPFRGIFPLRQISETGYFSSSALFAIMMYMFLALAMHSLINYVTCKMVAYQNQLDEATAELEKAKK